tara:strand:- start:13165 stop:14025 length:861 start_codon:yes stop_codon:yes gene_type:complete
MTVMVLGSHGQLGRTVESIFSRDHQVFGFNRNQLDLTHSDHVLQTVQTINPEVIINCVAYNDVDGAEINQIVALEVNAFAVRNLAKAARIVNATLIHYSTDFVFDGKGTDPYTEDVQPNPQSVYAMSKLLGEWFAQDTQSYVLRIESLFGGLSFDGSGGSLDKMCDASLSGEKVFAFSDRTVSPSYAFDVVSATVQLLKKKPAPGIYHCVGSGMGTWLDVANELANCLKRSVEIVPIRVSDRVMKARRPQFCALSNVKLKNAGIEIPSWQNALRRYVSERLAKSSF